MLCETNTTPAKISEVQRALSAAGYSTDTDDVFGASTLRATAASGGGAGEPPLTVLARLSKRLGMRRTWSFRAPSGFTALGLAPSTRGGS